MDLYILDELLRRESVVDLYKSLIWTDRYASYGDFELVIQSDRGTRSIFTPGRRLAIRESYRVMTVETVEQGEDDEGSILTVTGRSLEALLEDRVAMPSMSSLTAVPKWTLTGTPGNIARQIFQKVCVEGVLNVGDKIPFYTPGVIFPSGDIPEPSESVTVSLEHDTVYNSIKKICDMYNMGFRLIRNLDQSQIYFDVYTGDNRTTQQLINPPVIFTPELDNLANTSELHSNADFKNAAYVFSKNGALMVYAATVDPTVAGFSRRVLMVKADDIETPAGTALTAELTQRGLEALSEHRGIIAFDGEIPQVGSYRYPLDYDLGDLVEMRNSDGLTNTMRVTEQIFISDAEGERAYPTLSVDLLITPGSWLSWDNNQTWELAVGTWATA